MDASTVLQYGHYAGIVFVLLWIVMTNKNEGMWGNALVFFSWCIAAALTWALAIPTAATILPLILEPPKEDETSLTIALLWMAIPWLLFITFFALIRTATDKLSRVKVAFPPVIDMVGAILFSLLTVLGVTWLFAYVFPPAIAEKLWWFHMAWPT